MSKINKLFLSKNKKGISEIITLILIILIATVLIGMVVSWSKAEVKNKLDASTESLKPASEAECVNSNLVVDDVIINVSHKYVTILTSNNSSLKFFNIGLTLEGKDYSGDKAKVVGYFNNIVNPGEIRTLNTTEDFILSKNNYEDINFNEITSLVLTNGTCPSQVIDLIGGYDITYITLEAPTADPGSGTYSSAQEITLSAEDGSIIHYTIDGNTPTINSSIYIVPLVIPLDTNRTIKAISTRTNYSSSSVSSASYVITHQLQTPSPSVTPGMYSPEQTLTISGEAGSTYYYTLDGSIPTTGSTLYSGSITITYGYTTLKVLATKDTYGDSNIYTGNYYVYRPGRYWIGGSGSWSDTNHWSTFPGGTSGATVPIASNDVFFDENSFSANGAVVTLDVNASAQSIDFSGLDQNITLTSSINSLSVYGSLTLSTKLATSFTGTSVLNFKATTEKTITANGNTSSWRNIYFDGVGGSWINQDDWNINSTTINLVNGTWNTNSKTITFSAFITGRTNNGTDQGTKVLILDSSIINISSSWTASYNAINFTLNAGTSLINCNGHFYGAGYTYYDLNQTLTTTANIYFTNTFHNLTIIRGASTSASVGFHGNQTITGTLTLIGNNDTNYRLLVSSTTIGATRIITATSVVASNVDFRDINFANSINLADINGYSGDAGGNYGITFTTAQPQYFMHTSGAVSWSDATKWFSDYNRTIAGRVPLPQDDATFDANSFTGTSTLTVNVPRIGRSLDMGTVDDAVTFSLSNYVDIYGNFILGNNITVIANSNYINLIGRDIFEINTYNKTLYSLGIYLGTYTNKSNLTLSQIYQQFSGVVDLNDFNVTITGFQVRGGTIYLGNGIIDATSTSGTSLYFPTGTIVYAENSTLKASPASGSAAFTFQGGGQAFNNLWLAGLHTGTFDIVGSNTFNNLQIDPGRKVRFTAGTTQTITGDLNATGTDTNKITLSSITPGSYWKISKASGISSNDYLDISDSNATGGATWYAGANSLDTNHNTGWIFTAIPGRYWVGGTGNWSDINHWAVSPGGAGGASVPTSSDDVFFTAASFSVDGNIVTLDVNASAQSIDFSGLDQNITLTSTVNSLSVYGSLILSTKLATSFTNIASLYFKSTTTGKTITSNGNTSSWRNIYFDGVGGSWANQDDWTVGNTRLSLSAGTWDTNNKNITTTSLFITETASTKRLTLGSSIFKCARFYQLTSFTFDSNTSTVHIILNSISEAAPISGSFTFFNFTIESTSSSYSTAQLINQTISNTLSLIGLNSSTGRLLIASTTMGAKRTITAANVVASNVDFRDINGVGAFNWDLSDISGGSGNAGGNSGILFSSATPQYFKHTSGAVNWSDATKWFSDYNRTVAGRVPLPQDDATFDANSFTGTSTLTVDSPRIGRSLDMNAVDDAVAMTLANNIESYGHFILGNNVTPNGSKVIALMGRSDYNFNTYGKTIYSFYSYAYGGTYTNQSNLVCTGGIAFYMYNGTFDFNDYNLSAVGLYRSVAGSTIYFGNGIFTTTYNTTNQIIGLGSTNYFEGSTFRLNPGNVSNTITINSGVSIFNNIWLSGTHTGYFEIIGSSTINNLQIDPGRKLRFTAGSTTTIIGDFNVTGTDTNRITLGSITPGSYWNITKLSGLVTSNYLDISDSNATGGAIWSAGANSVDVNHNTGWTFGAPVGRYWVGGTGEWSLTNTTNWSTYPGGPGGASVPTLSNDVYFDANSGTGTVTVKQNMAAKSLICTGYTGALYGETVATSLSVYGNLILSSTMSFTQGVGFVIYFRGNETGRTITTAGQTPSYFIFHLTGGDITLQDDVTLNQYWRFYDLNGGTVNTNGKTINVTNQTFDFSTSYTFTGTFNFTNSIINLNVSVIAFPTTMTLISTGSRINLLRSTNTFQGGGQNFNIVSDGGAGGAITFTGANTTIATLDVNKATTLTFNSATNIGNFNYKGAATNNQVVLGANITVTGDLNIQGYSTKYRPLITSDVLGTPRTITNNGTSSSTNVDFRDINGVGTFNWDLSSITGGSGNAGGNSGILFTTAQDNYWVADTGSWSDSTKWKLSDHNTAGRVPLPQDNVFFDANSFTGASKIVTLDVARAGKDINFSEITNSPTLSISQAYTIYGSLTLSSLLTYNYISFSPSFEGRGTHTITSAGKIIGYGIYIRAHGGTYTLMDNANTNSLFRIENGTFNANDYNFIAYAFNSNAGTTINMGSGTWKTTGNSATYNTWYPLGDVNSGSSTLELSGDATAAYVRSFKPLSGSVFNNINVSGKSTSLAEWDFTNNFTVNGTLTIAAPNRIRVTGDKTITMGPSSNIVLVGNNDTNKIDMNVLSGTTKWNITRPSGTQVFSLDYLTLDYSNAVDANTFYAGANSIDNNHNTGWLFSAPSSGQLATPIADPAEGAYTSSQEVTLSADSGASIYYTLDGNTPTIDSNLYSGAITIPQDATTVLKAIAVKDGSVDSNISSGTYVIYTMSALFTLGAGENGRYSGTYVTVDGFPETITITKYSLDPYDNNIIIDNNIIYAKGETKDLNLGIINTSPTIKLYLSDNNIITKTTTNTNNAPTAGECPTGYIPVPGNVIYGTESGSYSSKKGFCVAKYEMKVDENNDGTGDYNTTCKDATADVWRNTDASCGVDNVNRILVSTAEGYPLAMISSVASASACLALGTNYHLITNEEYMTITRNIEIVTSNWSGGAIGSGKIKIGNNGGAVAGISYNGANPESGTGRNSLASLTLTNSEVIWDLSANLWEIINKTVYRKDQPDAVYDVNGIDINGSRVVDYATGGVSANPPAHLINDGNSSILGYNALRLITSSLYTSNTSGIGAINTYSDIYDTSTTNYVMTRGGYYVSGSQAGILATNLVVGTTTNNTNMAFRCVYVP